MGTLLVNAKASAKKILDDNIKAYQELGVKIEKAATVKEITLLVEAHNAKMKNPRRKEAAK